MKVDGSTSQWRAYDVDAQGSVVGLEDATTGAVPSGSRYDTDPYGAPVGPEDELDPDAEENPFRFQGFYKDQGTGTYDMQARAYRPETGRFLQQDRFEDPNADLTLASDPLTSSRYAFTAGNPGTRAEYNGHCWGVVYDLFRAVGLAPVCDFVRGVTRTVTTAVAGSKAGNQINRRIDNTLGGAPSITRTRGIQVQLVQAQVHAAADAGFQTTGPGSESAPWYRVDRHLGGVAESAVGLAGNVTGRIAGCTYQGLMRGLRLQGNTGCDSGEQGKAYEQAARSMVQCSPAECARDLAISAVTGGTATIAYKVATTYKKARKAGRAAQNAERLTWAQKSGILRDAARGKGNYGLGSATAREADALGRNWVGEGFTVASDGKTLVSADRLRQYRPPTFKPNLGRYQANFERKFPGQRTRRWQSNGHLDITNTP